MQTILNNIKQSLSLKKIINSDRITIRNANALFGTLISTKIDLTNISQNECKKLQLLIKKKGFIIIPAHRKLSEIEQLNITKIFGQVNKEITYTSPIVNIKLKSNLKKNTYLSSPLWHSEKPYLKNPPHISVMQITGNVMQNWETSFISLHQIFANLEKDIKENWRRIQIIYGTNNVAHPLLWLHPFNGKQCVYFDFKHVNHIFNNCNFNSEILLKETNRIIYNLNNKFSKNILIYNHKWGSGDIIIVDNYAISRREVVAPNYGNNTLIRNTTTKGIYF